jgi:Transposase DDE domain group 1
VSRRVVRLKNIPEVSAPGLAEPRHGYSGPVPTMGLDRSGSVAIPRMAGNGAIFVWADDGLLTLSCPKSRDETATSVPTDSGSVSRNCNRLLLGATDRAIGLVERFAECFTDGRAPELVEHEVSTMVGQRIFGIALGYEDLIDHDQLRHDPTLAVLAGKLAARRKDCAPLAGKSTLNRLELGGPELTRYHRVLWDAAKIEALFVDLFLEAHRQPPKQIILDLDATDDPLHGHQEGRFFHGYYDCYCYLPLNIFCGTHLLAAKQRCANLDASAGAVEEVARIVAQIRACWPEVRIVLRADAGFAREALMRWCELNSIDFQFGLAKNERLVAEIAGELAAAEEDSKASSQPARRFKEFQWSTRDSWSRQRRVVAKACPWRKQGAEWTRGAAHPRFVVSSLSSEDTAPQALYEEIYCARGDMENRIKECQLDLFADRTSAATMRANQLRLWFASMAYVLVCALRRLALQQTQLAKATCGTIRLKLLKIGALVRTSVRRITFAMASGDPYQRDFAPCSTHQRCCCGALTNQNTRAIISTPCNTFTASTRTREGCNPSSSQCQRAAAEASSQILNRYEKSGLRARRLRSEQTLPIGALPTLRVPSEWRSLKRRSAAHHCAAAARAPRLLAEATTPWVKEQLAAAVANHEQIAEEIERAWSLTRMRPRRKTKRPRHQARSPADNAGVPQSLRDDRQAFRSRRGRRFEPDAYTGNG